MLCDVLFVAKRWVQVELQKQTLALAEQLNNVNVQVRRAAA